MWRRALPLVGVVSACAGDDPHPPTGVTSHTGAQWPEVRCADRLPPPLAATRLEAPRASHDVAFDGDGHLIGSDDVGLWRFPATGPGELFSPGLGPVHQLEWLPDGGLAVMVATTALLERVDPSTGARVPMAVGGYAVRTGPDGWLWTADGQSIARVDPGDGTREVLLEALPDGGPKVLEFDRDGAAVFVGTVGGTGTVYRMALGPDGAPAGTPEPYATGVGGGWHDAIGLDACGGLYVADAVTTALYRVDGEGGVTEVLDLATEDHAHGFRWGSELGGWRADALYVGQPYGGDHVSEVVLGVPHHAWRGGRYTLVE